MNVKLDNFATNLVARPRKLLVAAALATTALATTATPVLADALTDCRNCCSNNENFCTTYWFNFCALPVINACEAGGGDESICYYNAEQACITEFSACWNEADSCMLQCGVDTNTCTY